MSNPMERMDAVFRRARSAGDGATPAEDTARHGTESAQEIKMRTFTNALAMIVTAVDATAGVIRTIHRLDRDDALAWLGLARRRSPLVTLALVGAGAAVGAGVALLFAPMAGAELRRLLMRRTQSAWSEVEAGASGAKEAAKRSSGAGHAPNSDGRPANA